MAQATRLFCVCLLPWVTQTGSELAQLKAAPVDVFVSTSCSEQNLHLWQCPKLDWASLSSLAEPGGQAPCITNQVLISLYLRLVLFLTLFLCIWAVP